MYYSRVISKGIPEIADERIFVVRAYGRDGGKPDICLPGMIEWRPENKVIGVVKPGISLICQQCGELMRRQMLCHTEIWMYTAFACENHPNNYLLDFFPKVGGDTAWDYTNSFMANLDPVSNPALPLGVTITNFTGPEDRYATYLKTAKGKYCLTPNGIISADSVKGKIILFSFSQKIISKMKHLFHSRRVH